MSRTPREHVVETRLKDQAVTRGLIAAKWSSPGFAGVPDQIVTGRCADGTNRTVFVELKRPGARPRPQQRAAADRLREVGAVVVTVDHTDGVDQMLDLVYGPGSHRATPVPYTFYRDETDTTSHGTGDQTVFRF